MAPEFQLGVQAGEPVAVAVAVDVEVAVEVAVDVGVLVAVFVGVGVATNTSSAPMSVPAPCGRVSPSKSFVIPATAIPVFCAGEPVLIWRSVGETNSGSADIELASWAVAACHEIFL